MRLRLQRTAVVAALLLLAACRGPVQSYAVIDSQLAPLRAQFNADAAHPRIVIMPAPT